ncbi:hypothetical protein OAH18_02650 [bacterium]|nr:hypothetical protein [bacterium]
MSLLKPIFRPLCLAFGHQFETGPYDMLDDSGRTITKTTKFTCCQLCQIKRAPKSEARRAKRHSTPGVLSRVVPPTSLTMTRSDSAS